MSRRWLIFLLGAALVPLSPAPASAAYPPGWWPNERLANNAMIEQLLDIGYPFLQARGIQPCPRADLTVWLADTLNYDPQPTDGTEVVGRAPIGGCTVYLRADWVGWVQDVRDFNAKAQVLCYVVVHELGHTAGLEHAESGFMRAVGDGEADVPYPCKAWGDRVIRRKIRWFDDQQARITRRRCARAHATARARRICRRDNGV